MIQPAGNTSRLLWVAGFVLLYGLAACGPAGGTVATPAADSPTVIATDVTAASPTPLPLSVTAVPPTRLLPATSPTVAAPPSPTSVQTSTPGPDPNATAEPEATGPTETPRPTFTPPPPPPTLEGEHLFLQRPVPASGPAWTDKAYPYGSTRGGRLRPHTGVEFIVSSGTPVLAAAAGTVLVAGDDNLVAYGPQTNFYGNLVVVELDNATGGAVFILYGHLSEVTVEVGQRVAAGDVLGLSGASGIADGPHLHFEVRVGENSYVSTRNPLLWLLTLNGTGVVAGRVVGTGGELLYEAPVTLQRVDGPAPFTATTSYAQGEPNADGRLAENFALDDVVPGYYEAVVDAGERRYKTEVWVYPGRVNWVEIVVGR